MTPLPCDGQYIFQRRRGMQVCSASSSFGLSPYAVCKIILMFSTLKVLYKYKLCLQRDDSEGGEKLNREIKEDNRIGGGVVRRMMSGGKLVLRREPGGGVVCRGRGGEERRSQDSKMIRRSMRNNNDRSKEQRERSQTSPEVNWSSKRQKTDQDQKRTLDSSSRANRPDKIEVTPRSPIKNQRKRKVDTESEEPLKKSPKVVIDYRLGAESSESLKKSLKDGASAVQHLQKEPDGPPVAVTEDLESCPSPEPEKMDCSDATSQVSPDGNQSEGNKDSTVSPQDPADEDMDLESEVEADKLQDPIGPSASQTFSGPFSSAGNMQKVPDGQPKTVYSSPIQADYIDAKPSVQIIRPRVPADIHQPLSYRDPQNYIDAKRNVQFKGSSLADHGIKQQKYKADIHQPLSYRDPQNDIGAKRNAQFKRLSMADHGIKQQKYKGSKLFWKFAVPIMGLIAVLTACILCLWVPKTTVHRMLKREEFLQGKMKEIQTRFPNQREELWVRSTVLLKKHVGTAVHTQPVILMFTAAQDAKGTMRCLVRMIAEAYVSAFNSSVLEINGSDMNSLNSDEVKLGLDNQLSSRFKEGRKAAIIHHFQDLPPPSTLLFYKYCDHENAAFKDISLLITVLLDEPTLNSDLPLNTLEETVHDFLRKKLCSDKPGTFNVMNIDKLSGLWSRISHLVLPVKLEKEIETGACPV
ncbi:torsin-1A-interacting protein 1-like [Heterodontus francisci]|uniref:torsin-1A-interacting protein 1-like n=1 Tax=Heterodontus francisci TaxID=7792 RepID=UPI00355B22A0